MTLTPYLTDYKSVKEVKKAFDSGKDFIIADFMHKYSGKPANKKDLQSEGLSSVQIRFGQLRKITVINF